MNKPTLDSTLGLNSTSPFLKQITPVSRSDSWEDEQVVPNDNLEQAPIVPRKKSVPLTQEDTVTDIDYVRRTLQFSTERAQQLVDLALQNASDAANPRDIEVASTALNTCADISEKLLTMYKTINELKNTPKPDMGTGNTYINNNNKTVVLSSAELLRQLSDDTEQD